MTTLQPRNRQNFMIGATNSSTFRRTIVGSRALRGAVWCAGLGLVLLAGCSDDPVSQSDRVVAPTAIAGPSGVGPSGEQLTLEVVDGGSTTGLVITDHRGFAVYGVADEAMSGAPVCFGTCLDIWIPLTPRDDAVADRLNADLYEVYLRPDGIEQATYAGVPLYLWSGDSDVGITGGAGVAGTWFALTAAGGYVG